MKSTTYLPRLVAALLLVGVILLLAPAAATQAQTGSCSGYYYTVRPGDTWSIISRRVGVTVWQLKLVNPQAVRPSNWVIIDERLCIPSAQTSTPQGGYWYDVKKGDTWNVVSRLTGVSVRDLWAANPTLVDRVQWLYVGQRIWIPSASGGSAAATATPTPSPSATAAAPSATVAAPSATAATPDSSPIPAPGDVVTPTVPSAGGTVAPTAGVTVVATGTLDATQMPSGPTPVGTPGATGMPPSTGSTPTPTLPPIPGDCPATLDDYGTAVAAHLNTPGNTPETLQGWLVACRAVGQGEQGVVVAPITAASSEDVIVTIVDPIRGASAMSQPAGRLFVYHGSTAGYRLAHTAGGAGRVELVAAEDANLDKKFDVIFSDTICGAHTCFATLSVISWDGRKYADWIDGEPTMAGPEYALKSVTTTGQGKEIVLHGGVIGSVGAGPQRAWTETYISPKGAAYELGSLVYDPSPCLYFAIVDANEAFDAWALEGFDRAVRLYRAALKADRPETCGTIENEVATLQDFARFRLIVAAVAAGSAGDAPAFAEEIKHAGLAAAADTFLTSYRTNTSVIQACRDVTKLAQSDKSTWEFLGDWGYANPSFTPGDLCPLN